MDIVNFDEIYNAVKTNKLNFYNIYAADLDVPSYFSAKYYHENPKDSIDIDQPMSKAFTDIEVYTHHKGLDFKNLGQDIISAITVYSNIEKIFYAYIYLDNDEITKLFGSVENKNQEYYNFLIENKYISEDDQINIQVFRDELEMICSYWTKIKELDPIVISGFNCLEENESVWLDDRIIKIKNSKKNLKLFGDDNIIIDYKCTNKKDEYLISLINGFEIKCSLEHKFPIYSKLKNVELLENNKELLPIKDIISKSKTHDIFVKQNKRQNQNKYLTYKNIIIDHLKTLLLYDHFDFVITTKKIQNYLKTNYKDVLKRNYNFKDEDFQSKSDENTSKKALRKWSYKNLKTIIPDELIYEFIQNSSDITFLFADHCKKININNIISDQLLQLLGFIFTNGAFRIKDNIFTTSNTDHQMMKKYMNVVNTIRKTNCTDIQLRINNDNPNINDIYIDEFSRNNELSLLYPLIYTRKNKKKLSLELLSRLSEQQFFSFLSGLIDGDGSIQHKYIQIYNYKNSIQNNKLILGQLLFWNGIYCNVTKNGIHIPVTNLSKNKINKLTLFHTKKSNILNHINLQLIKSRISNKNNNFDFNKYSIVKIDTITKTNKQVNMYDIKTSTGLFTSGSIFTHNSDTFDYPYLYERLCTLKDKQFAAETISIFNYVGYKNGFISIPEYTIADLLYLYKPRAEGGMNFGKMQTQYNLGYLSDIFLNGVTKVDYDGNLDTLYETDPSEYLKYNIGDVALTKNLDNAWQHIDFSNTLRRTAKTPYSVYMRGQSLMFDTYVTYKNIAYNKTARYGIAKEANRGFEITDFNDIPAPKQGKKGYIKPTKIDSKEYVSLISKYSGAYVKQPKPQIINDKSLLIDLDAAKLYPSMIMQHNISFDTYRAFVLDPSLYKVLNLLKTTLGSQQIPPSTLYANIFSLVKNYIEKVDNDKAKNTKILYYSIAQLFNILYKSNITFDQLCNPKTDFEYSLLKTHLIQLLDLIKLIHPDINEQYNQLMYDYYFMDENEFQNKHQTIWIYQNPGNSNTKLVEMTTLEWLQYQNQYCNTIAGTMFDKHENKLGIFTEFLQNLVMMRTDYKKKRDTYKKGQLKFSFYDARQNSVKTTMNSSYGVLGLSSFRYSNHNLAQSITSMGRLTLKMAQQIAQDVLTLNYG